MSEVEIFVKAIDEASKVFEEVGKNAQDLSDSLAIAATLHLEQAQYSLEKADLAVQKAQEALHHEEPGGC